MMARCASISGGIAMLAAVFTCGVALAADATRQHPGKALVFNSVKGNCLACHGMPTVEDAEQPGNSGPPLIAMTARFPDKATLRARIWDASVSNPGTFMPPFGKHKILTDTEIDQILDFVYGL